MSKNSDAQEEYVDRVREKVRSLIPEFGTQHNIAIAMGVSDTAISRLLGKDRYMAPAVWKWLVDNYDFPSKPPVDPRPRRWIPTNNMRGALKILLETYPELNLYMQIPSTGKMVLITEDLL